MNSTIQFLKEDLTRASRESSGRAEEFLSAITQKAFTLLNDIAKETDGDFVIDDKVTALQQEVKRVADVTTRELAYGHAVKQLKTDIERLPAVTF